MSFKNQIVGCGVALLTSWAASEVEAAPTAGGATPAPTKVTLPVVGAMAVKDLQAHQFRPAHVKVGHSDDGTDKAISVKVRKPKVAPKTTLKLDVASFGTDFHAALKDKVTGYVMQLRKNGTPVSTLIWNWGQSPSDKGEGWTLNTRMHVASVSKLITAIAMTKLLDSKNLSYDTKISGYLPAHWAKGANIDEITFRMLLTQTAGFAYDTSQTDYAYMKGKVAEGVMSVPAAYDYENMNFGLCRILISVMNGTIAKDKKWDDSFNDAAWDLVTIGGYAAYVKNNVFLPSGVTGATFKSPPPAGGKTAFAYEDPADGKQGWDSGNLASVIGGAGWRLTLNEVLNVLGTFRRKGSITTADKAQSLLDSKFGIDRITETAAGKIYDKNGAWCNKNPCAIGDEEQAVVYFLPEKMEIAVFVNSPIGTGESLRDLVRTVYQNNLQ